MPSSRAASLIAVLATTVFVATAAGISLSSLDSFDADNEGWTANWDAGAGFDGESGIATQFSDGAYGRRPIWRIFNNTADWTGNYLESGVTGVSVWVDGQSGPDIPMYLGLYGPGGWFHTSPQTVITADGWTQFLFSVSSAELSYVTFSGGTGNADDTLGDVTLFEMLAGEGTIRRTGGRGGNILYTDLSVNTIAIDQISAVPEPAVVTALLGLAALAMRRRAVD